MSKSSNVTAVIWNQTDLHLLRSLARKK